MMYYIRACCTYHVGSPNCAYLFFALCFIQLELAVPCSTMLHFSPQDFFHCARLRLVWCVLTSLAPRRTPTVSLSDTWRHGRAAATALLLRNPLVAAAAAALLVAVEGAGQSRVVVWVVVVVVWVQQDTNAKLIDLHGLPSGPHILTSRRPWPLRPSHSATAVDHHHIHHLAIIKVGVTPHATTQMRPTHETAFDATTRGGKMIAEMRGMFGGRRPRAPTAEDLWTAHAMRGRMHHREAGDHHEGRHRSAIGD